MKRLIFLSFTVLLCIIVVFSIMDNDGSRLYVPTPEEIHEYYEDLSSSMGAAEGLEFVLSDSSDIADKPLLRLGVLSSFYDVYADSTILIAAAPIATEEVMPNLRAEDCLIILSDEGYPEAFKFVIIDIYSYIGDLVRSGEMRNFGNFSSVDEKLKDFVVPNSGLAIEALTSIQDKTIISSQQLLNLLEEGTISEKKVSLRALCELYPDVADTCIRDIISTEESGSELYQSAIYFRSRLSESSDEEKLKD